MASNSAQVEDRTYLPEAEVAVVVDFLAAQKVRRSTTREPLPRLVAADGTEVVLPGQVYEILLQVVTAMHTGLAVTIAPHHLTLSTQEAADLLGVARTTLVRLLESGAIPFEKPNRHRKIKLVDLLEYRERQRSRAEEALADMVADTERLGLYETDPETVRTALKAARAARANS
ncbi:helix-turn-helix domain protein [mine drainage metagenome]|uniref:Helix-turn-helix domain protein n=1 Tax=mine drainage metagenome TaxID=410659 RepID=A0A1J5QQF7_9ZZZZ